MVILQLLLRFISRSLCYVFGVRVNPDDFATIFSENRKKFSCHVFLNKNGILFRNNINLGRFMQWAVTSLEQTPVNEFSELFVNGEKKKCFVADMAV